MKAYKQIIAAIFAVLLAPELSASTQLPDDFSQIPRGRPGRGLMNVLSSCANVLKSLSNSLSRATSRDPDPGARPMRKMQRSLQNPNMVKMLGRRLGIPIEVFNQTPNPDHPSGDFYRIEVLPDGRVAFFVGDVEGKGPFAAALSMFLHPLMHLEEFKETLSESTAVQHLIELDQLLDHYYSPKMNLNIAMSHFILDPMNGQLDHATAGFPPLILIRADGTHDLLNSFGMPLKVSSPAEVAMGSYSYSDKEFAQQQMTTKWQLKPGDMIVVMSDGFWEAPSREKKILYQIIQKQELKLPAFPNGPNDVIQFFRTEFTPSADDATILVFKWPGPKTP